MQAATMYMICWFPTVLFSLPVSEVYAEPCARLYLQGLDSTTTFYLQLAGIYKLQKLRLSQWISVGNVYLQYYS